MYSIFSSQMFRKIAILLTGVSLTAGFVACNSSSGSTEIYLPGTAQVTDFSFSDCPALSNMDTVFFTIDQLGHRIFNADSMPVGTKLTRLVPRVTSSGASIIEFIVPREGKEDTTYNYLTSPTDSIDFSSNKVRLRIVSLDGQASNLYEINVNVHTVKGDTLVWQRLERSSLPTQFVAVNEQHTTATDKGHYCLTRYEGNYCIAFAENPAGQWSYVTPNFGFTPDIDSFTGSADALYILDKSGNLYASKDEGATWTATGRQWTYIYGAYGSRLLGSHLSGGTWTMVQYPGTETSEIAANFPVRNTSQTINRSFEMSDEMQMILVGGRLADGSLSNDVWSYDGNAWACLSTRSKFPRRLENLTLVPYFTIRTSLLSWTTTRYSVLMAMNGNSEDGTINDTIYVSRNFGMNWMKADSMFQAGERLPLRTRAQAFAYNETMTDQGVKTMSAGRRWKTLYSSELPLVEWMDATGRLTPYATKPVTEWECPYLYLFGGVNAQGQTLNTLYRGVITYFQFKPLQ